MKITQLNLKNFKRFTDLSIRNIPETAKLVLLIGSNGSGKSSIFDAFNFFDTAYKNDVPINEEFWNYYKKDKSKELSVEIKFENKKSISLSEKDFRKPELEEKSFYGRTSFRQVSRLTRTSTGLVKLDIEKDDDRPKFFIDKDSRFENDLEKIGAEILKDVFRNNESSEKIREKYISPINSALENIFGSANGTNLQLIEIIPPLDGKVAQITFRKGKSEFHYNYLSAGEKEVINILINLLTRRYNYEKTIYYFDEIDLHLNTQIQYELIKEIINNWIPDNSQLWTASHSLGFIDYAKNYENSEIIDFDDLNFDRAQEIKPTRKSDPKVYEIAVSEEILPSIFQDKRIFFVENKDKSFYAQSNIKNAIFVSAQDKSQVFKKVIYAGYNGIIDRDYLTEEDIQIITNEYKDLKILDFYSIENYLYHPENLEEYFKSEGEKFNKSKYINEIKSEKSEFVDEIKIKLLSIRTSYPFFNEKHKKDNNRERFQNSDLNIQITKNIIDSLNSSQFETFYKYLPMKEYGKQIKQRQNIPKNDLAKTKWFKNQITEFINR